LDHAKIIAERHQWVFQPENPEDRYKTEEAPQHKGKLGAWQLEAQRKLKAKASIYMVNHSQLLTPDNRHATLVVTTVQVWGAFHSL
jgi:hypothetical protein